MSSPASRVPAHTSGVHALLAEVLQYVRVMVRVTPRLASPLGHACAGARFARLRVPQQRGSVLQRHREVFCSELYCAMRSVGVHLSGPMGLTGLLFLSGSHPALRFPLWWTCMYVGGFCGGGARGGRLAVAAYPTAVGPAQSACYI